MAWLTLGIGAHCRPCCDSPIAANTGEPRVGHARAVTARLPDTFTSRERCLRQTHSIERARDRPCRKHARDLRATHGGMRRFSLPLRPAGVRRAFPARRVKREAGEWRRTSSIQARRCPRNGESVRVVPQRDPTARAEPLFADRRMGRWATKTDERRRPACTGALATRDRSRALAHRGLATISPWLGRCDLLQIAQQPFLVDRSAMHRPHRRAGMRGFCGECSCFDQA